MTEGVRRSGGATHGIDYVNQPSYRLRFLDESFTLGDALEMEKLRFLVRRLKPTLIWVSPPCQGYSTVSKVGVASMTAKMIPLVSNVLETLDVPFVIENVMGARSCMLASSLRCCMVSGLAGTSRVAECRSLGAACC